MWILNLLLVYVVDCFAIRRFFCWCFVSGFMWRFVIRCFVVGVLYWFLCGVL